MKTDSMKFGIVWNKQKQGAASVKEQLVSLLDEKNISHRFITDRKTLSENAEGLDVLFIIGGDGTILRFADVCAQKHIPICGINAGHIGFLTEVSSDDLSECIDAILHQNYEIESRMMLSCYVNGEYLRDCLNDVVFMKKTHSGIARLSYATRSEFMKSVSCDGMIIYTPTGSTGYNISAGGPVLEPFMNAIGITPICPHTIYAKPFVISSDDYLELSTETDGIVSVDGQMIAEIKNGHRITITESKEKASFIRLRKNYIFDMIKNKLDE